MYKNVVRVCLCMLITGVGVRAQDTNVFPRVRGQSLETCRKIALGRSANIVLASSQLAQARADLAEQQSRIKINTAGGLDPLDGQVRFYLSLDLERLLQLNKQQREKAKQQVKAQAAQREEAQSQTIRRVSAAWYAVRTAEANVTGAGRNRHTTQALHVAADARFKAGEGTLSAVLSSLRATREAEDTLAATRQALALACLDLAQACGYATAEAMEGDLP